MINLSFTVEQKLKYFLAAIISIKINCLLRMSRQFLLREGGSKTL